VHRLRAFENLINHPTAPHLLSLLGVVVILVCALAWVATFDVTLLFAVGIALESFSGNWKFIPIPFPVDRVILLLAALLLLLRGTGRVSDRKIVFRPIHFLLLGVVAYVAANALWVGTLQHSYGFYALLDRLGFIPFLMFTLAPILFGTARQRNVLLVVMVILGLYLGVEGTLEGIGSSTAKLVFPHYITNASLGITSGRTRGPFLASDAMGLALFDCSVFAAIALREWTSRRAQLVCVAVIGFSTVGIIFTLTRSVWIGSVLGLVVTMAVDGQLRRHLPKVLLGGVVGVVAVLLLVPGLRSKAGNRVSYATSVWDRYNTNNAALRAVEAHPIFGIGWQTFETVGPSYLREAGTYPLTGVGLEVHNVFLSHFAEIGVFGGLLWALALFSGVGGAIVRRGSSSLYPWRLGLLAMFCMFLVVANLGPLSYPLPNLLLWLMAGIVGSDRNSTERYPGTMLIDGVAHLALEFGSHDSAPGLVGKT